MIAALASPLARWAAVAVLILGLLSWVQWERASAVAAIARADEAARHLAAAQADLSNRRTRDEVDREVDRLPGPDAADELRRDWGRTP